ncbi:hypothetical protein VCHA53O466_140079 [Vibrio chagasii]|nr:hypothetical protein VCHA53O466_140079 [Vibrio chagasii]
MDSTIKIRSSHTAEINIKSNLGSAPIEHDDALKLEQEFHNNLLAIVERHETLDKEGVSSVEINPDFHSIEPYYVGLIGNDLDAVKAAAKEIVEWIDGDELYSIVKQKNIEPPMY